MMAERILLFPRQSLHSDDRILWVNPKDSRHVIKGDDGGVGISYDQAKNLAFCQITPPQPILQSKCRHAKTISHFGWPTG